MRCIYCNNDKNLTVSDIIPVALTGAKVRKRFVCRMHNSFTNVNYERKMISQLDIFRNRIGLTERDGDPVRFFGEVMIGDYTSEKNVNISDNKSIMDSDRLFKMKDKQGRKMLIGPKEKLLKINGVTEDKIIDLPVPDISISSKKDLRDLFISEYTLHTVAKIAYEWHCFINDIEEFYADQYNIITSYILNPEQANTLVEIVTDVNILALSNKFSRPGTNMLFEYHDFDGGVYVVFCLWNVITYKIRVTVHNEKDNKKIHCPTVYFYHADGTQDSGIFGVIGDFHVISMSPAKGLFVLSQEIKSRLSEIGERDLSREYLQKCIAKISKDLLAYQEHKISIEQLLDFEHEDRVIPIYVLEQIYTHRDDYMPSEDFYLNARRILQVDNGFTFTRETKKLILERYVHMDCEGTFATLLNAAIDFFKTICDSQIKNT